MLLACEFKSYSADTSFLVVAMLLMHYVHYVDDLHNNASLSSIQHYKHNNYLHSVSPEMKLSTHYRKGQSP